MTRFKFLILLLLITGCGSYAVAQDSVVGLLKNNRQQAERYFELGEYEKALDHFKLISRQRIDYDTQLKIARCLFFLKEYKAARSAYAKLHATTSLPMPDLLYYAQLNASTSNYSAAIENYHSILQQQPGDAQILQQIWQLTNVHLLFEDSLHYTIRRLPVNTREADLAPFPHGGGIVFLSDRKNIDFTNPDKESSGSRFT